MPTVLELITEIPKQEDVGVIQSCILKNKNPPTGAEFQKKFLSRRMQFTQGNKQNYGFNQIRNSVKQLFLEGPQNSILCPNSAQECEALGQWFKEITCY